MGRLDLNSHPNAVLVSISYYVMKGLQKAPSVLQQLYDFPLEGAGLDPQEHFDHAGMASLSPAEEFSGEVTFEAPQETGSDRITPKEFVKGIRMDRKLRNLSQWVKLRTLSEQAGYAMYCAMEKEGLRPIMYMTATTDDRGASRSMFDDVAVVSASHPSFGDDGPTTQSNTGGTNKLTYTNWNTAVDAMDAFVGDNGEPGVFSVTHCLRGHKLRQPAGILFNTEGRPHGQLNDENNAYGTPDIESKYITDFRWCAIDMNVWKDYAKYYINDGPVILNDENIRALTNEVVVYADFACGFVQEWRMIYGSIPTAK
jgi:hypothetical protein|tara:strand:- start:3091 stop:4029 length:939 start_codon:yes stop_codon:yes gene_type:complete